MLEVKAGDLVLHNYNYSPDNKRPRSYLCGRSFAATAAQIVTNEPPNAGKWANRGEYYRIELRDFLYFANPLRMDLFIKNYAGRVRDEIEHYKPRFFPCTINRKVVRVNQGMYLTRITSLLYQTIIEALNVEAGDLPAAEKVQIHNSVSEGERRTREAMYFVRNPGLAKEAKAHFKHTCQLCGFRAALIYGARWAGIGIECHHLDPFSERPGFSRISTIEDVTVLCANCHRLVHSRKPAYSLTHAKTLFKMAQFTLGPGTVVSQATAA
jgi:hypothetical protein